MSYDIADIQAANLMRKIEREIWFNKIEPVLMQGGLASNAGPTGIPILANARYHLLSKLKL